ncbi:LacI family DNA-binding transcriptional regulator [Arachnia propionica]|uniref:LacI family transcriptional regulator n=1 Tax=Arachnia propionica TaxID=1750 RepID=A0A3P1WXW9_9ACTN|nr:LacI family DNA-binding transcriptional regulator [Arachnia propionica]RRD51081.1 LacI family transcriptional regulator [Arachnia propionica]
MTSSPAKSRPTLVEVARAAGVSVATASRSLSRRGRVAKATRDRVEAAAERLGFTRNAMATSLRGPRASTMLGLIVPSLVDPFFAAVAAGLQTAAAQRHLGVMVACHHGETGELERLVRTMVAHRTLSVIFVPIPGPAPRSLAAEAEYGTVLMALDAPAEGVRCDTIVTDNRSAAERITSTLLARGHRSFFIVALALELWTQQERLIAIRETLQSAGVPLDPGSVVAAPAAGEPDATRTRALLERQRPDAVIGLSILPLVCAIRVAREAGLAPDFACFDKNPLFDLIPEAILGVEQDPVAIGRTAVERVSTLLEVGRNDPETLVLPWRGPFVWGGRHG